MHATQALLSLLIHAITIRIVLAFGLSATPTPKKALKVLSLKSAFPKAVEI
jgi:hypothetical protein